MPGWRVRYIPAPIGTESHLWASKVSESARGTPARTGRSSGTSAAPPPHAASTCSQSPHLLRHLGDLGDRIDRAGAGRAHGGDDEKGRAPLRAVRRHTGRELRGDHPQGGVHPHLAHRLGAEPAEPRRLEEGVVGLRRDVEHRLAAQGEQAAASDLGEGAGERRQQRGMVRLRAPRGEGPLQPGGVEAEAFAEGADQMLLDLGRHRAVAPGGELRVEGGHQGVGGDPHRGRCRVEQPEVARMRGVDLPVPEALHREVERLQRRHRPLEVEHPERAPHRFDVERRRHPRLPHPVQICLDRLHQAAPEVSPGFVVQNQGVQHRHVATLSFQSKRR